MQEIDLMKSHVFIRNVLVLLISGSTLHQAQDRDAWREYVNAKKKKPSGYIK
jgi:hypothetical protein